MTRSRVSAGRLASAAACAAVAFLACSTVARGTILTFEGIIQGNNTAMPQTYGDRVSTLGPDANGFLYQQGSRFTETILTSYNSAVKYYNDAEWPKVAYLTAAINEITFTPDVGSGVRVNSFQLLDYTGYGNGPPFFGVHNINWKVYDTLVPTTTLASGSLVFADGGRATISTGLAAYYPTAVTLQIHQAGQSNSDDLAMDNLNFDQLPEPAAAGLLMAGLVGLCLRRPARTAHAVASIG